VPLESILIFAKPSNLVVQTGMITVGKTQHLLLPDIYVKKGINITKNALYILNLRHFFGRSKKMIRIKDKSYTTLFAH
jgi:hypothetical protein